MCAMISDGTSAIPLVPSAWAMKPTHANAEIGVEVRGDILVRAWANGVLAADVTRTHDGAWRWCASSVTGAWLGDGVTHAATTRDADAQNAACIAADRCIDAYRAAVVGLDEDGWRCLHDLDGRDPDPDLPREHVIRLVALGWAETVFDDQAPDGERGMVVQSTAEGRAAMSRRQEPLT